jgi:hypothetical protein
VPYCLRGILIRSNWATVTGKIGKGPYNTIGKTVIFFLTVMTMKAVNYML